MIKKDEELQQNEGGGTIIEKKDLTLDRDCASIHLWCFLASSPTPNSTYYNFAVNLASTNSCAMSWCHALTAFTFWLLLNMYVPKQPPAVFVTRLLFLVIAWPKHLNYTPTDQHTHVQTEPGTTTATGIPPSDLLTDIKNDLAGFMPTNTSTSQHSGLRELLTHLRIIMPTDHLTSNKLTNRLPKGGDWPIQTVHRAKQAIWLWQEGWETTDCRGREADASADDRVLRIVEISPSHRVHLSNQSPAAHGNIITVWKKAFIPSLVLYNGYAVPVEPNCTNHNFV